MNWSHEIVKNSLKRLKRMKLIKKLTELYSLWVFWTLEDRNIVFESPSMTEGENKRRYSKVNFQQTLHLTILVSTRYEIWIDLYGYAYTPALQAGGYGIVRPWIDVVIDIFQRFESSTMTMNFEQVMANTFHNNSLVAEIAISCLTTQSHEIHFYQ